MFKKTNWKWGLPLLTVAILALLAVSFVFVNNSQADAPAGGPEGLTSEPIVAGELPATFNAIFVNKGPGGLFNQTRSDVNQIHVIKFTLEPGGHFGWHQHGGPVWAVVAEGTLTYYESDRDCTATEFAAGSAFMDPGDVTHTARNETGDNVVIIATFMLPAGGPHYIPAPDPGYCNF
jgi:quercetin dioxygenase-like cupin family protein